MKLWVDDVRPASEGYLWCQSVNAAKLAIQICEDAHDGLFDKPEGIEVLDLDHDAGNYANDGGDYIRLLDWLEETGRNYPIRIHSMNPVGVANMRSIIQRNRWVEVKNRKDISLI